LSRPGGLPFFNLFCHSFGVRCHPLNAQVAPSKGWSSAGGPAGSNGPSAAAKTVNEVAAADEDGPDWTFFTEWAGNVGIDTGAATSTGGSGGGDAAVALPPSWMANQPVTGIDMAALSDQSVPILFYDDVALYEDELHDFGYDSK